MIQKWQYKLLIAKICTKCYISALIDAPERQAAQRGMNSRICKGKPASRVSGSLAATEVGFGAPSAL
jgi:hypothetical protein